MPCSSAARSAAAFAAPALKVDQWRLPRSARRPRGPRPSRRGRLAAQCAQQQRVEVHALQWCGLGARLTEAVSSRPARRQCAGERSAPEGRLAVACVQAFSTVAASFWLSASAVAGSPQGGSVVWREKHRGGAGRLRCPRSRAVRAGTFRGGRVPTQRRARLFEQAVQLRAAGQAAASRGSDRTRSWINAAGAIAARRSVAPNDWRRFLQRRHAAG